MEFNEDEFLMISGLQHYAFCKRQWALIHIEQQWAENFFTVDGDIFHKKAHDQDFVELRSGVLTTRGLRIYSRSLGVSGTCDVVEFHRSEDGIELDGRIGQYQPIPVEYKRGEAKVHNADELQLCAQAMCLEEMLLCKIQYGYLYYGQSRHRTLVDFTEVLRNIVQDYILEMHQLYDCGHTPKVKINKRCKSCSLEDLCLPKLNKEISVSQYFKKYLEDEL